MFDGAGQPGYLVDSVFPGALELRPGLVDVTVAEITGRGASQIAARVFHRLRALFQARRERAQLLNIDR
ncbi:hypothetical protein [Streptomyces sp. CT34]|uniref:hypothetical protein n=1 Tax=Streptomyces sp. CT34 TaxID=1553907 RepID=UPI0012FF459B|nr:hypothetical protein [Streptomyces sp. CT34]